VSEGKPHDAADQTAHLPRLFVRRRGDASIMALPISHIRGIVTVMGDDAHQERTEGLGSALNRLSAARERRGPVGVLDPFELTAPGHLAAAEVPRAEERRGLFRFSQRARDAVQHDVDVDDLGFDLGDDTL
jgi:hypothetical protein